MSALADLSELVGFFSYSREDDEDSHGALSALRDRIQRELRGQLGVSMKIFRLWQDKEAIPSGTLWEEEIKTAIAQSVFFIPIITPTVVRSRYCRFELDAFLAREAALGRNDLLFPILYRTVSELESNERRKNDPVISIIAKRQYLDWRKFRHRDIDSAEVKEVLEKFCMNIWDALHRPQRSPEERMAQEESVLQRAEVQRKRPEAAAENVRPSATQQPPRASPGAPVIVLVDDSRDILTSVSIAMEAEGYTVRTYTDGASALEGLIQKSADLGIFDIKMPKMDGWELFRRVRQFSEMPIIFLTSKDEEIDELVGLRIGADDYILKPFSQRLLVERVKLTLRRSTLRNEHTPVLEHTRVIERGKLRLDPDRLTCHWGSNPIPLTVTEFLILQALAARPGVVKSRNALMDEAYDDQVYVDDRTIDSHIKRLRKKFKAADDAFDMIETLYGVGYRFRENI